MERDSSDDDDNGEVNAPNIRARSSRRMTQMRLMHIHSISQLMVVMQVQGQDHLELKPAEVQILEMEGHKWAAYIS